MGRLGRIARTLERKLDGPAEPPPHQWPAGQAWALLLSSERNPGSISGAYRDESPSMLDDAIDRARGIPYGFQLEVHRPERAPYTRSLSARVPAKVEGTLFLRSHPIPPGVEVPLRVTGSGAEDFELDWDGYLAIPGQADRAYHLRIRHAQDLSKVDR